MYFSYTVMKTCYWYSLEVASEAFLVTHNTYFCGKNTDTFGLKTAPYLDTCIMLYKF